MCVFWFVQPLQSRWLGKDGSPMTVETARAGALAAYQRGLAVAKNPKVARAMVNQHGQAIRVGCIMQVGSLSKGSLKCEHPPTSPRFVQGIVELSYGVGYKVGWLFPLVVCGWRVQGGCELVAFCILDQQARLPASPPKCTPRTRMPATWLAQNSTHKLTLNPSWLPTSHT